MPFYKFGCCYVMLYNFQNTWCSFCLFCEYWFEIINYNMHYIHVLQMSCMWIKDGAHFKFNSGQFSGQPTKLSTISILESSGLPTGLPTELPHYIRYMAAVGSLICMAKFPWAAHGQPTSLPTTLPPVSIYGSSGQPNLHGKIPIGSPWAAHSATHWTAHCFHIWK